MTISAGDARLVAGMLKRQPLDADIRAMAFCILATLGKTQAQINAATQATVEGYITTAYP
jgi:hypothetical protein